MYVCMHRERKRNSERERERERERGEREEGERGERQRKNKEQTSVQHPENMYVYGSVFMGVRSCMHVYTYLQRIHTYIYIYIYIYILTRGLHRHLTLNLELNKIKPNLSSVHEYTYMFTRVHAHTCTNNTYLGEDCSKGFQTFFVQAFKIVVDS